MKRKQSLKLSISFKENLRDLEIYNFLNEVIKDEIGISTYIKMLISEDMKNKIVNDFNSKISKLDSEMIRTIEVFFNCGLNLSESAKELYIHRNTLIYRLDKIQKVTSYDIREFNNAMIFKIIFLYIGRKNNLTVEKV